MAKQGILPVYDTATKRILGVYVLPAQKIFTGEETTHNLSYPDEATVQNTVNVQKVVSPYRIRRPENEWFMAAVFTREQIRLEQYKGFPNFVGLDDPNAVPTTVILAPASHAHGQVRYTPGMIMGALHSGRFTTVAPDEEVPEEVEEPPVGAVFADSFIGSAGPLVDHSPTLGTWAVNSTQVTDAAAARLDGAGNLVYDGTQNSNEPATVVAALTRTIEGMSLQMQMTVLEPVDPETELQATLWVVSTGDTWFGNVEFSLTGGTESFGVYGPASEAQDGTSAPAVYGLKNIQVLATGNQLSVTVDNVVLGSVDLLETALADGIKQVVVAFSGPAEYMKIQSFTVSEVLPA